MDILAGVFFNNIVAVKSDKEIWNCRNRSKKCIKVSGCLQNVTTMCYNYEAFAAKFF